MTTETATLATNINNIGPALDFAAWAAEHATELWLDGDLRTRERLQGLIFPDGLAVRDRKIETAQTSLFFNGFGDPAAIEGGMVDQTFAGWNRVKAILESLERFRRSLVRAGYIRPKPRKTG